MNKIILKNRKIIELKTINIFRNVSLMLLFPLFTHAVICLLFNTGIKEGYKCPTPVFNFENNILIDNCVYSDTYQCFDVTSDSIVKSSISNSIFSNVHSEKEGGAFYLDLTNGASYLSKICAHDVSGSKRHFCLIQSKRADIDNNVELCTLTLCASQKLMENRPYGVISTFYGRQYSTNINSTENYAENQNSHIMHEQNAQSVLSFSNFIHNEEITVTSVFVGVNSITKMCNIIELKSIKSVFQIVGNCLITDCNIIKCSSEFLVCNTGEAGGYVVGCHIENSPNKISRLSDMQWADLEPLSIENDFLNTFICIGRKSEKCTSNNRRPISKAITLLAFAASLSEGKL